jgi:hypothetical protein
LLTVDTGRRIATIKVIHSPHGGFVKIGIDADRAEVDIIRDNAADDKRRWELRNAVNAS